MNSLRSLTSVVLSLAAFATIGAATAPTLLAQGALTPPPGAPAPTMKSLGEIDASLTALAARTDARIAIDTLPGDATAVRIISAPGSYYLRGNLTSPADGVAGIRVAASGVVIDLNGFALIGSGANSTATAIDAVVGSPERLVVRNGAIVGWNNGVHGSSRSLVENLIVRNCAGFGIYVYPPSLARHVQVFNTKKTAIQIGTAEYCTVREVFSTGAVTGIYASIVRHCEVTNIAATGVGSVVGINATTVEGSSVTDIKSPGNIIGIHGSFTHPSRVQNCTVEDLETSTATATATGIEAVCVTDSATRLVAGNGNDHRGIEAFQVQNCNVHHISSGNAAAELWGIIAKTVHHSRVDFVVGTAAFAYGISGKLVCDNLVTTVDVLGGSSYGIRVDAGGQARRNVIENVITTGIQPGQFCTVAENTLSDIGDGTGIGIHVTSTNCRIENNSIAASSGCDFGIRVTATKNFLIGNRCTGTFGGVSTGAGGVDTPEFNIVSGNRFGSIVSTFLATGEITALNPWANFSD